eukprot:8394496-Lingulodinium_polyedra.AAC.1
MRGGHAPRATTPSPTRGSIRNATRARNLKPPLRNITSTLRTTSGGRGGQTPASAPPSRPPSR